MNHVILKDGATAVISRVKPQPTPSEHHKDRWDYDMGKGKKRAWGINATAEDLNTSFLGILDFAPYRIGDKVAVKEAYLIDDVGLGEVVVYKSDVPDTYPTGSDKWLSPVTMPIRYVRKWAIVESVECVRVRELTDKHIVSLTVGLFNHESYTIGKRDTVAGMFICKNGTKAWNENEYIFITSFKIEE